MNPMTDDQKAEILRERDLVSVVASLVLPGLGHLYKGHYRTGLLLMFLGIPAAIWVGIILSLATAGLGLIFPIMFWAGTAVSAYFAQDWRTHHMMDVF